MSKITAQFKLLSNPPIDRRGTMVLPAFQKKRFGTVLTHHCNTIADNAGCRTFVTARPTSIKMFRANGFTVIGHHDSHLERWGGSREKSISYITVREPPSE